MSRRSRAESEESFSLFPFLAVLLCTMGTLALVFVLIAQKTSDPGTEEVAAEDVATVEFDNMAALGDDAQYGSIVGAEELAATLSGGLGSSKLQAVDSLADPEETTADDSDAPKQSAYEEALVKTGAATLEDVLGEKESVEWFLQELEEIDSHSNETFEEERQRLANAEAGIAKLREEADVAQKRFDALMNDDGNAPEAQALKDRVAQLDIEIEKLQEEAAELRDKNANAKKSYAIVPYQGKKGTFRRPIYVECKDSGVFIQPEGVRFDERDFLLAQYPGNPFDTALRAAAQRYLVTGGQKTATGETIEPYPLIIVRPSGSQYFYAAIAALASWGELYGYEFVEEDQELAFPAPDPVLAQIAQTQADAARNRMQAQLATMLSIRNAQIVSDDRMRRNAQRGGLGNAGDAPVSELQARLGSNVRVGAANPLAGANRAVAPVGAPQRGPNAVAARPGTNGAPIPGGVPAGGPMIAGQGAPQILMPQGAAGVFSGAANSVAASAAANAAPGGAPGTELVPAVPYTGQYAQNMTLAPENAGAQADGVDQNGAPLNAGGELAVADQSATNDASNVPEGENEVAAANAQNANDGAAQGELLAQNGAAGIGPGAGDANAAQGAPVADGYLANSGQLAQDAAANAVPVEGASPQTNVPVEGITVAQQYVGNAAAQDQLPAQATPTSENTAPLYMQNFVETPSAPQNADPSNARDLSDTLGNTTYAVGANGESGDGTTEASAANADSADAGGAPNVFNKNVDLDQTPEKKKEIREDEKLPKEAYLVSKELTRTATRGSERGILVKCGPNGYVFPKQPGLRSTYAVAYEAKDKTRQDRDAELADVVTLCVKSWGVAGRNMFWAPYMKVEVAQGGERGLQELQEFCDAQGLTLVQAQPEKTKKK